MPSSWLNAGAAATDNCNIASITYQDAAAGTCPLVVTRTFIVTDDCGNQTTVAQSISIDDTTPPTVTAPTDLELEACDSGDITTALNGSTLPYSTTAATITVAQFLAEAGAAATDNCNIASITYQDAAAGTCPLVVTRTFIVTDDCGNQTTVAQSISIDDTTPPTVTAPTDLELKLAIPVTLLLLLTDQHSRTAQQLLQ